MLFDEQLQADINHQYSLSDISSLRMKLAQYPTGTKFLVNSFGPEELLVPVLRAIREVASENGLIVESQPKEQ